MSMQHAAKLMNVSLDMVRKASVVARNRPDLEAAVCAGQMTVNEAYRTMKGNKPKGRVERAMVIWRSMTDHERQAFEALISMPD